MVTPGIFVDRIVKIAGVSRLAEAGQRMTTQLSFDPTRPLGRDDLARLVAADIHLAAT